MTECYQTDSVEDITSSRNVQCLSTTCANKHECSLSAEDLWFC